MAVVLVLVLACAGRAAAETYYAHGYHGGYYLTNEEEYRRCLDRLFAVLDRAPAYKTVLEIEPYTLQRMQHGDRFACERRGRREPVVTAWSPGGSGRGWKAARLREAGKEGFGMRLSFAGGAYANCCQPLPAAGPRGHAVRLSGWIRSRRGRGAHLYIDAHGPGGFIPGSARRSGPVPADGKWHRVSVEVPVPAGAVLLYPQAKIDGQPGEADFDGLSLRDRLTGEELLANGGFEQAEVPRMKDPARLERLRRLVREGRAEIVGGAYTQPILYTIDDESTLRQLVYGCRAVEDALGVPVKWYAAQEPDMAGQLPQILRQAGFRGALYRTHWAIFGSPPTRDAEVVDWVGPDGSRIPAFPAYSFMPLIGYGLPGEPTPGGVAQARKAGLTRPLFSILNDLVSQAIPEPNVPWLGGEFGSGWANLCHTIPAEALRGKDLVLSGSVRARLPGAALYIDAHDAGHRVLGSSKSAGVPADGRWHRVEILFRVPADATLLFPQGQLSGSAGEADFDGLSLKVVGDDAELLRQGSFEAARLPKEWSASASEGAKQESDVGSGDAAEGERFVRLQMRAPTTPARFATLEEYAAAASAPKAEWRDAYAGFEHRFPFGLLAGEPQRVDRETVDAILRAERVCALLGREARRELRDAWELALMQQHHDGWVCAPTLFGAWRGYDSYAHFCAAAASEARAICRRLLDSAGVDQAPEGRTVALGLLSRPSLAFHNVRGEPARQLVQVRFALKPKVARRPALYSPEGKPAPGKLQVLSLHRDGSAREVRATAIAEAPAFGTSRYTIRNGKAPPLEQAQARASGDGVLLWTRHLQARVSRHGLLEVGSARGEPLLRAPLLLAGQFDAPATSTIASVRLTTGESGPAAVARGRIGPVPFIATVRLSPFSRVLRLGLELDFGAGTDVGAKEDEPNTPRFARSEEKLRLVLPLPFPSPRFYTHGAFEVRPVERERHVALRFAAAQGQGRGVAVFPDRASAILCRQDPAALELALAYGGGFLYAPGERAPLTGRHRYEIGLAFYEGGHEQARLPQLAEELSQPLLVSTVPVPAGQRLTLSPPDGAVLTAAYPDGRDLLFRLWNPAPEPRKVAVTVPGAAALWTTDLRGRRQKRLASGSRATIRLRPQGFATLRSEPSG